MCDELCTITGCNIYLFDPSGHIFAYSLAEEFSCPYSECSLEAETLPEYYMDLFEKYNVSVTDRYSQRPHCTVENVGNCLFADRYYSMYPIFLGFKKVAGLLFIKYETPFCDSDRILCEYTCAIVSIEIMRQSHEKYERLSMDIARAQLAVDSLTFSEKKAVRAVLEMLGGKDGEVFLNAIAESTFTTPSTVSGALKKMELAGMIKTKTMGVKGKFIHILNPNLALQLKPISPRAGEREELS